MIAEDLPAFEDLLNVLGSTFGKDVTQELRDAYWLALKDLSLSTIRAVAQQHVRFSKFFPKPVELRPREDRDGGMGPGNDAEFNAAKEKRCRDLDLERVQDPIGFAVRANESITLQRLLGLHETHPEYRTALREYRYWLDMNRQPIEVQRQALPTFAAEERMTMAERHKRMEYIREKRAQGIKANQLVFPQERPQETLPNEIW